MRITNIKKLEKAADMIEKAMWLIDVAVEKDGDTINRSDEYFLTELSRCMQKDSVSVRRIAKVAREDIGL